MQYVTAAELNRLTSLQDLDPDSRARVIADAQTIEAHVSENPWIGDAELRTHCETLDLDPDRVTAALAFLNETGRVVGLPDLADAESASEQPAD